MVIWKGINLLGKGIIVEKEPNIIKGQKNISIYEIEGRNGNLVIDNGTYKSFTLSINCHLDTDVADIDEIKELLDGYGTLSLDGKREYYAYIKNSISFTKVIGKFKSFIIQFQVNPIAHDINSTLVNVTKNGQQFNINKGIATNPIISIKGEGNLDITVNNTMFKLFNLNPSFTYRLDCENKVITANGLNVANQMQYDFPSLRKGTNTVNYTGTVNEFKIEYKKAYL